MSVSRSCYYHWHIAPKTKQEEENEQLIEKLKILFEKGRGTYGTRRLKNRFAEQNIIVSRRRISRLMVQAGLWCETKKKFKVTTDSKHNKAIASNLLERQFTVSEPDRYYVGDITDIHRQEGWLYLAVVIDLFSRKIVDWSMDNRMKAELVHQYQFKNRNEAKQAIFEYIEVFYNRERIHSANDYLSPVEYENQQKAVS